MAAEIAKEIFSQSNNLQDEVNELKGQVSTLKRRLDTLESGKKPLRVGFTRHQTLKWRSLRSALRHILYFFKLYF